LRRIPNYDERFNLSLYISSFNFSVLQQISLDKRSPCIGAVREQSAEENLDPGRKMEKVP
jgi:hypothetical protein